MATDRERGKQAQSQAFAREVKAAVADYFERNRLSRHANAAMVMKTVVLLTLYFGSYGLRHRCAVAAAPPSHPITSVAGAPREQKAQKSWDFT